MKNWKKIIKGIGIGVVCFHLATQVVNWTNDLKNAFFPSRERTTLKQEFNVAVSGWKADVEEGSSLGLLADVAYREQLLGELELKVSIPSRNYFKKSLFQQIRYLFMPSNASYDTVTKGITVEQNIIISSRALSHEAKHQRTFYIRERHPELIERWKAFATDENGKTLYYSPLRGFLAKFRGINRLVRGKETLEENNKFGFITKYARTNVYEDIAELCAEADELGCFPNPVAHSLFNPEQKNDRIIGKIKLAKEYKLIPAEFSEILEKTQYSNYLEGEIFTDVLVAARK